MFTVADTHYVDLSNPTHSSPYTSWATAANDIQTAVNASTDGDTVLVTNGTYWISSQITVTNNIIIKSVNGPLFTEINGGDRGFFLGNSSCTVEGFKISGYDSEWAPISEDGAAILCTGLNPIIKNCFIENNWNGNGNGAISYGRAYNCKISLNAGWGAAASYQTELYGCLIYENFDWDSGSIVKGGRAYNCTIVKNISMFDAGAVNSAILRNSIVWNNHAVDLDIYVDTWEVVEIPGSNISGTIDARYACSPGLTAGIDGNINSNPQLDTNYRPLAGSPCIGSGTNGYISTACDLAGNPRVIDSVIDMGAYEFFEELGDLDGDGLVNAWEEQYFGSITNAVATADPDGDGQNNATEQLTGMDPTSADSVFAVSNFETVSNGTTSFVIEWPSITGRVYNVLWSSSLTNGFQGLESNIHFPQNSYTDTFHDAESKGFYRMGVQLAE